MTVKVATGVLFPTRAEEDFWAQIHRQIKSNQIVASKDYGLFIGEWVIYIGY